MMKHCLQNTATQDRLQQVRALFDFHNINAYIITIEDVHMVCICFN